MTSQAILLSDLHYSQTTSATCFDVLRFVHREAVAHGSHVFFLGDFWDHVYRRGTLPVDLLNHMIRFFKEEWQVKTIMIPGNHDYFDSAETEHGLEAFQGINNITVLNESTYSEGLLFLPFRRDPARLRAAIAAHASKVVAIFGHLDVIGARMNSHKLSAHGCAASDFPVPTYSGHYHSPSTIGAVTYIGSPYQVHLSEAGDDKALVLVNLRDGTVAKKIPINVGRRHFKRSALSDIDFASPGDRVVLSAQCDPVLVQALRDKGVSVDVKVPPPVVHKARLENDEDKVAMFVRYLRMAHDEDADRWIDFARERVFSNDIVSRWLNSVSLLRDELNVLFDEMTLHNFGPFVGTHRVHFSSGMTLVTGNYRGKAHTDSNGVGKSLYSAGALLWVCAGKTDPRFGGGNVSVISEGEDEAYVILHGSVSGKKFTISRGVGARTTLTFHVEGEDRGSNTIRMTQTQIARRIFGRENLNLYDWLTRSIVWTQRSCPRFLDASDASSKIEVAQLVNLDFWTEIFTWAKERVKTITRLYNRCVHFKDHHEKSIQGDIRVCEETKTRIIEWEAVRVRRLEDIERELSGSPLGVRPETVDVRSLRSLVVAKTKTRSELLTRLHNPSTTYVSPHLPERRRRKMDNRALDAQLTRVKVGSSRCELCLSSVTHELIAVRRAALEADRHTFDDLDALEQISKAAHIKSVEDTLKPLVVAIRTEIAEAEAQISNSKSASLAAEAYDQKKLRRNTLATLRDTLNEDICPFDLPGAEEKVQERKQLITTESENLTRHAHDLEMFRGLVRDFGPSGIQSYVMESATRRLTELVGEICNDFSFAVTHSDKEKLVKTFQDKPLSMLSGGEYQRLQIACFLAYRRLLQEVTGWRCNLIVLDEPDTYVDASGVRHMMNMIKTESSVSTNSTATVVISHTNSMHRDMNVFDHHVEIERDAEGSRKRKRV